jgi:hypothetical protein
MFFEKQLLGYIEESDLGRVEKVLEVLSRPGSRSLIIIGLEILNSSDLKAGSMRLENRDHKWSSVRNGSRGKQFLHFIRLG